MPFKGLSQLGTKNVTVKNFNRGHDIVRERRRGWDKHRIIQGRVISKGLGEEFSFRDM